MKIGFIGTGAIAEAVIHGLCSSASPPRSVVVSPRSAERSSRLAGQYDIVTVADDNQTVVDGSDWTFVTVTPDVAEGVLQSLEFRPGQNVINCVSTLTFDAAKALVAPGANLFKAVPLPPNANGLGPVAYCPYNENLELMFGGMGTAVAARDETEMRALGAVTSQIAAYHTFQAEVQSWLEHQNVPPERAQAYVSSMFHALSSQSVSKDASSFEDLGREALTPGGLNDQSLSFLKMAGWFSLTSDSLDGILKRLNES